MVQFTYPPEQRKRGASMKTLAVCCYALLLFFLLAGFWGMDFVPYVFAVLTVAGLLFFYYGADAARAGKGSLEFLEDGIFWQYKRRKLFIPYDSAPAVTFGGAFFKKLTLTGDGTVISVYRTLASYPAFWRELKARVTVPALPPVDLTVRCNKTDGMGIFVSAAVLLLSALIGVWAAWSAELLAASSLVAVSVLFGIVLALIVILALAKLGSVTFGQVTIVRSTPVKKRAYSVDGITSAAFEQARIRLLAVGYRYRGPALPAQAVMAEAGLGLVVRLDFDESLLKLDETMTRFPLELLYDYLLLRYQLPDTAPAGEGDGGAAQDE